MDFHLNEDQQAFADSARALFADFCSDDALREHDAGNAPFMQALWAQCVATGLHAIVLDEAAGGLGQGATELMAVLEQQGRALALVPLAEHQLAVAVIAHFAPALGGVATALAGSAPALAPTMFPGAARGETLATLSLGGLSAARGLPLSATRDGTALRLDGMAAAVPLASQAAMAVLPVRLDSEVRLVAVDPRAVGVTAVEGRSQHHLAVADLRFEGARLDAAALLAPEALAWLEPRAIAALASLQLGVSAGQLARTVEYVSQRKQFGRVIGSFQLVAGQMADAQIAVEALRSALAQLVYRIDAGLGALPQALAVKVLAAQAAHVVGHKAQHVHGGIGVDVTYPIHRFLYWSRALAFSLGGAEASLQRLGDWLATDDRLGWKYDLPEDLGITTGENHAVR
jgi:alkylation response protein AidB-like acyl-CoA dehydrogenase